jgi:hypothetical protein
VERRCAAVHRYALLSQAACEAALQLQLPRYASVHEHWKTLQNRSEKAVPPAPYTEVLGEKKCAVFGQEVTFIANDWHAGLKFWHLMCLHPGGGLPWHT